jgi:polyferredoxin
LFTNEDSRIYVVYQPHHWLSVLLCVAFLALLAMNLRVTRFWCRALCPLGALLGMESRWSILGLHKDAATCNRCIRCLIACQGGDDPIGGVPWRKAECRLCLNCVEAFRSLIHAVTRLALEACSASNAPAPSR